jgi:DNA N-6-adenine-methyltransferase Dam/ParB-like nuclease family protein
MKNSAASYQVLPPLSAADYAALKQDIAEHGILVPVEYDDAGNILDGHHRIQACGELGITGWPRIVRHSLTDHEKRRHARALNLARRHLDTSQKRELIAAQLLDTPEMSDRKLGDELGVSHNTVASVRNEIGESAQSPLRVDKNGVQRVLPVARRSYSFVGADNDPKLVVTKYTGEYEWYTPAAILDAARSVLGAIDLDPASCIEAQQTVNATTYYTDETDGLAQHWTGRVWLNPPYAADLIGQFVSDTLILP